MHTAREELGGPPPGPRLGPHSCTHCAVLCRTSPQHTCRTPPHYPKDSAAMMSRQTHAFAGARLLVMNVDIVVNAQASLRPQARLRLRRVPRSNATAHRRGGGPPRSPRGVDRQAAVGADASCPPDRQAADSDTCDRRGPEAAHRQGMLGPRGQSGYMLASTTSMWGVVGNGERGQAVGRYAASGRGAAGGSCYRYPRL